MHPADEFVQGPLFHPKWSAQYPPLSFSVWYSLLSRALRRVPRKSTTCARHSSATCCSGHSAQAERVEPDKSPARTHRRWCVCDPNAHLSSGRAPRSVRNHSLVASVHHRHEDDAVGIRLRNTFLAKVVESRRDALFVRRQQLHRESEKTNVSA